MSMTQTQTETDYPRSQGGAAIGARLRRLSETLDYDAARVYGALGIRFEQRWFGVLNQLDREGPMSVGDLAARLKITHVSVSQTRQSLEKAGIIVAEPDESDARRRLLTLTPEGRALIASVKPLWRALDQAALALNAAAGEVVVALDRLDDALAEGSLFDRAMMELAKARCA